jgi:hypothetical protein
MKIRVETKNHQILLVDLSGEWRVEPLDLHCLVGPTVAHYFTPDGYYDHAEPRPDPSAPKVGARVDVGPAEGGSWVP